MIFLWMKRFILTSRHIFKFETFISLASLTISVACLVVTLTVMSSYETTLKNVLIERTGHLVVVKKEGGQSLKKLREKIESIVPYSYEITPFISLEALVLNQGKLRGIFLEGVDLKTVHKVLNLKTQLISGNFIQKPNEALVGKRLAEELQISLGSAFYISYASQGENPQLEKFILTGIMDLGRYDFNSRYVVTSLNSVQKLSRLENQAKGVRVKMSHKELSEKELAQIGFQLGTEYWVQDWKNIHRNLFQAIQTEKFLIFFILLILVFVAGFHVSNQLFLDVLKRFRDIGILKTMGAPSSLIIQLFVMQGITVGVIGNFLGFVLGIGICFLLIDFYDVWESYIPSEAYQLNQLILDFRWQDFLMIFIFSIFICVLNTMIPIRKSLMLTPKEGLVVE